MNECKNNSFAFILGLLLALGLVASAFIAGRALMNFKMLERTVTVKGLSEKEMPADIASWNLQFSQAANSLTELYNLLKQDREILMQFLEEQGFSSDEISVNPPAVIDKVANSYSKDQSPQMRYLANQIISVYSKKVENVRKAIQNSSELGAKNIALTGSAYDNSASFMFSSLNAIKPQMVEEATQNARSVAQKFADDSGSVLGKIKKARQGQFSIIDRDSSTPHIKKVRVVSTIEYYLK